MRYGGDSSGAYGGFQSGVSIPSLFVAEGGEDSVTAFAGGGQGSATALSSTVVNHRVTTVATAADSVKLPAATVGARHVVKNSGAGLLALFPATGETIDALAANASISIASGASFEFFCVTAGQWFTQGVNNSTSATGMVLFQDNAIDIGTSVGSRPRSIYAATSLVAANTSAYFMINTDAIIFRPAANSFQFGGAASNGAGQATTRTEMNKAVTTIADAAATAVLTITVPNAAHACGIAIRVVGSLGAGGAIGAFEASATNEYDITIARTAGVNAVAGISPAYGVSAANVAGAATCTAVLTMSAVAGAVGATNTFTVNVTITRSGGSSTNHTAVITASSLNSQATGITIL